MATKLKNLPIGTQSFETLVNQNYLYVDKTEYIYNLIDTGRIYFLSRPRLFGKSLLISTLEAIFKGQKELFRGLWIESSDYDWQQYPVIRLDMGNIRNIEIDEYEQKILEELNYIADKYNINLKTHDNSQSAFKFLIRELSVQHGKVVVLIDEYDKPILDNILKPKCALEIRDILRNFYGVLKSEDANLQFVFLTGVAKFSKTSIFSGLNNLNDISLDAKYGSLLGITEQELDKYFSEYLKQMTKAYNTEIKEFRKLFKHWYNGYMMCEDCEKVYNPFSVLSALSKNKFRNFWFSTETPSFLLDLIIQQQYDISGIEFEKILADKVFSGYEIGDLQLVPLLLQTGYLTIDSYNDNRRQYSLKIPNYEVESSLNNYIFEYLVVNKNQNATSLIDDILDALEANKIDIVMENISNLLKCLPYDLFLKDEKHYHSMLFLIFKILGIRTNSELHHYKGRVDMVLECEDEILVIELKRDKSAQVAMQAIKEKEYAKPYEKLGKAIHLLGINFNSEKRVIDDWAIESL